MKNFNGLQSRTVFSLWMGNNPMSEQREQALLSIQKNIGCPSAHIDISSLANWIHDNYPLHPAFPYLSAVHRSDYLRCYLMNFYGGGYTDIKHTSKNWGMYFKELEQSEFYALGYTEIGPHAVAKVGGEIEILLMENWQKILGMCAFIFKPQTDLSNEWFEAVTETLNRKLPVLLKNPAKHPQDHANAAFSDGTISEYPLGWTELLGDILHPLMYRYSSYLIHKNIEPLFHSYR